MAEAVRMVLEDRTDVQGLWRIKGSQDFGEDHLLSLRESLDEGRVRIMKWLTIDTLLLLQEKNVVLSVYHGGSTSCNEAIVQVPPPST